MNTKVIFLFCILAFIGACKKNKQEYKPDCSGAAKSFATDVTPLMNSYCATNSGCHGTGSSRGPGPLTNYTQFAAARSSIRSSIVSGSMPQGTTLSNAQKNAIVCWIDSGAPNN